MKRSIIILLLLLAVASLGSLLLANATNGYNLSGLTIAGGGGTSQGGQYRASVTIGQEDAATMDGGSYTFSGGFWALAGEQILYLPVISNP